MNAAETANTLASKSRYVRQVLLKDLLDQAFDERIQKAVRVELMDFNAHLMTELRQRGIWPPKRGN